MSPPAMLETMRPFGLIRSIRSGSAAATGQRGPDSTGVRRVRDHRPALDRGGELAHHPLPRAVRAAAIVIRRCPSSARRCASPDLLAHRGEARPHEPGRDQISNTGMPCRPPRRPGARRRARRASTLTPIAERFRSALPGTVDPREIGRVEHEAHSEQDVALVQERRGVGKLADAEPVDGPVERGAPVFRRRFSRGSREVGHGRLPLVRRLGLSVQIGGSQGIHTPDCTHRRGRSLQHVRVGFEDDPRGGADVSVPLSTVVHGVPDAPGPAEQPRPPGGTGRRRLAPSAPALPSSLWTGAATATRPTSLSGASTSSSRTHRAASTPRRGLRPLGPPWRHRGDRDRPRAPRPRPPLVLADTSPRCRASSPARAPRGAGRRSTGRACAPGRAADRRRRRPCRRRDRARGGGDGGPASRSGDRSRSTTSGRRAPRRDRGAHSWSSASSTSPPLRWRATSSRRFPARSCRAPGLGHFAPEDPDAFTALPSDFAPAPPPRKGTDRESSTRRRTSARHRRGRTASTACCPTTAATRTSAGPRSGRCHDRRADGGPATTSSGSPSTTSSARASRRP